MVEENRCPSGIFPSFAFHKWCFCLSWAGQSVPSLDLDMNKAVTGRSLPEKRVRGNLVGRQYALGWHQRCLCSWVSLPRGRKGWNSCGLSNPKRLELKWWHQLVLFTDSSSFLASTPPKYSIITVFQNEMAAAYNSGV